jgi:hypothetical protein
LESQLGKEPGDTYSRRPETQKTAENKNASALRDENVIGGAKLRQRRLKLTERKGMIMPPG